MDSMHPVIEPPDSQRPLDREREGEGEGEGEGEETSAQRFDPLIARTRTTHRPAEPVAYDCVRVIFVRDGSTILFSEFGQKPVSVGDIVLLGANVLCGSEPEGHVTTTTIYLDTDYVIDQLFWQHAWLFHDRLEAQRFTETVYGEPAQVLRLGEDRTAMLTPWLDELVARSIDGGFGSHFHRMQSLWFAIADVVTPFVKAAPVSDIPTQGTHSRPTQPRDRKFAPMREEARQTRATLKADISRRWTLKTLAVLVHLSPKQLSRVFTDSYGRTPLAFLTMLRVEEMARLLRETNMTIAETAVGVGWSSRSRANEAFRECIGVTPSRYRQMVFARKRLGKGQL